MTGQKKIYAVGLGPGAEKTLTPEALEVLKSCEIIAGYSTYLEQFPEIFKDKKIISSGMTGEMERCRKALDAVNEGHSAAVVSSGDSGIYGMAGLLMELTEEKIYSGIEVKVIPGLTAAIAAAAILGAPLMNDFAVISLSNLMTPENLIMKRIEKVAEAGLVCALYNPSSRKRKSLIRKTIEIFIRASGPDTLAGIVRNASRPDESKKICTLREFPFEELDMFSLVIIGNAHTVHRNGKLITLRGYSEKYKTVK